MPGQEAESVSDDPKQQQGEHGQDGDDGPRHRARPARHTRGGGAGLRRRQLRPEVKYCKSHSKQWWGKLGSVGQQLLLCKPSFRLQFWLSDIKP